jgi:hypothetical protein
MYGAPIREIRTLIRKEAKCFSAVNTNSGPKLLRGTPIHNYAPLFCASMHSDMHDCRLKLNVDGHRRLQGPASELAERGTMPITVIERRRTGNRIMRARGVISEPVRVLLWHDGL